MKNKSKTKMILKDSLVKGYHMHGHIQYSNPLYKFTYVTKQQSEQINKRNKNNKKSVHLIDWFCWMSRSNAIKCHAQGFKQTK